MVPAIVIFVCVTVIAILEASSLVSKKDFLNKPVRFCVVLLCLGLIAYFAIERPAVSGNGSTKEKTDSLENEVNLLHAQIDTLNNTVTSNKKTDSSRNNAVITQQQKSGIPSTEDTSKNLLNKKERELTDPLRAEFQKDVKHYFSKYNLPPDCPIYIICRTGDDRAYDFAEKLNAYLKTSGYHVVPIVNKMQLRSKKMTSLDMNLKDNRVEINIGSEDISSANPILVQ